MRFYAATAFEKILSQSVAKQHISSGLNQVISSLLNLMDDFDNEELVAAFENIVSTFDKDIGPHAI